MQLPGLVTVHPDQTELIERLAIMMGTSFMEEKWTALMLESLDALDASRERKLSISQEIFRQNFAMGTPHHACYALPDESACAGAYLASELHPLTWAECEAESDRRMARDFLTAEEAQAIAAQTERMAAVSNFDWQTDAAQGSDFIHFYALGVDPAQRGSGAFRRLIEPFLAYADKAGVPCFLETYSDRLEGLYGHFGFVTIGTETDPELPIVERRMRRDPR